jgi:hypothetical protein
MPEPRSLMPPSRFEKQSLMMNFRILSQTSLKQ